MEHLTRVIDKPLEPPNIHLDDYRADLRGCKDEEARKLFKSSNAWWYSSVQSKPCIFHSILKNSKHYLIDFKMNRLRVATHLVSCSTSLEAGYYMSRMAWIFSRFASIPRRVTMNPRNFSTITPKVHLLRFNFI